LKTVIKETKKEMMGIKFAYSEMGNENMNKMALVENRIHCQVLAFYQWSSLQRD
jgi:NifU-like protein involved in Fe-S cluster formation